MIARKSTTPRDRGTSQRYRNYHANLLGRGNWFAVPRSFFAVMTTGQALLVGHLLNVARTSSDDSGWIAATPRFLETGLGLDRDRQEQLLHALARVGLVDVEYRGPAKVRSVRIDLDKLDELLDEAE